MGSLLSESTADREVNSSWPREGRTRVGGGGICLTHAPAYIGALNSLSFPHCHSFLIIKGYLPLFLSPGFFWTILWIWIMGFHYQCTRSLVFVSLTLVENLHILTEQRMYLSITAKLVKEKVPVQLFWNINILFLSESQRETGCKTEFTYQKLPKLTTTNLFFI